MNVHPIGYRPSYSELQTLRRVSKELGCSRSDLMRSAVNGFVDRLKHEGLVSDEKAIAAHLRQGQ